MRKILTVVGARPQFVKAAVLSRLIRERDNIEEILVHTGQHFDQNMSDVFFTEMDIPKPDVQLNINSMGHGKMTGAMMGELEEVCLQHKPDVLVVYGDTNSTLAGALVGAKIHIPVAHVEAGLRSFNMRMPEEINRILTDRISRWLFCPTSTAVNNLKAEGYSQFSEVEIHDVGDIMLDAVHYYTRLLDNRRSNLTDIPDEYILCTLHRQENVHDKERLRTLVDTVNTIHSTVHPVVLPLHPGTAKRVKDMGLKLECQLIDPVGYFDMLRLLKDAKLVLTDSGGLQKEAYFMGKACVTMRDQTEWVELVDHGVNKLGRADKELILSSVNGFLAGSIDTTLPLYGNGDAGNRILEVLES